MTAHFMDPELFSDFIIEAKEHLETIEPNLLRLEQSPDNLSLLNDIFRPMHSLKGASGFLGLNKMNTLAHKAENILDELRKGSMPVTPEIMDIILAATDALRQMIDNLEESGGEGEVDIAPLAATLDSLMAGSPPSTTPEEPNKQSTVDPIEQSTDQSSSAKAAGNVEEWLAALPVKASYALTAFGEGHLKDFIEEAKENLSHLADTLLELEKNPGKQKDLVNDLFRLFHNLKGNSGIIGFQEANSLTHEAETLLNAVRKDAYPVTPPLVDLLLLVVDVLEALVYTIDSISGMVSPFDTTELLEKLRAAIAGETITMPESLLSDSTTAAPAPCATPEASPHSDEEREKILAFSNTVGQQISLIETALAKICTDGLNPEGPDALFRALTLVQNACSLMQLEDLKVYAERTAGIVKQGRDSGLDFSMLQDILEQECAIIRDMCQDAIATLGDPSTVEPEASGTTQPTLPEESDQVLTPSPSNEQPEKQSSPGKEVAPKPEQQATAPPPAKPQSKEESQPKASSTIRVDHEKLDHLMNLIGELIINRNRYSMLARQLEDNQQLDISVIAQNLSETTYAMARISDDLQDTIMKVRMVPVASVFSRFPRLVRDLSRKSGKEVELIVQGDETELDKSVVEVIGDPLVHLIRNSVDHGIEPADVRAALNKSPKGTIYLRAYYKGNSVAIEIEDDGKGIDPVKMRETAVRKGVISAEDAKMLNDREAIDLIFAPGFSSAEVITDISGRGVGMDVVRTNIKNLKGSISINSEVDKGTKLTISLPLTLAIIDALMVNVAGETYAIPLDAVCETTKIEAHRLTDVKGRKAVTLRDEVLGIVSLADMLELPCSMAEQSMLSIVVIQDSERRLGLVVDSLLERQEIVIKPLGSYLGDLNGISGATIMGDGGVILILDPHEIYLLATSKGS